MQPVRFPRNIFSAVLRAAAHAFVVTAVTVLPVMLYSRLLRAEGPLALLYAWTALCALTVFFAAHPAPETKGLRLLHAACVIAAAVFCLAAILAVLAQVNVARRSLAEAWLELARQGRAFGFFSFFASEIYALFCLAQALLLGARRYPAFALCAAATNFLCAGIILNRPSLLILSLVCAFLFFLVSVPSRPEERLSIRLQSVSFPVISGLALATLLAFFTPGENRSRQFIKTPDFSALFTRLAPTFPLLRDVPGYGFSAGGGDMPDSVYLSQRTLFKVNGTPFALHYLAATRYRTWNGTVWTEDPDEGKHLPLAVRDGTYTGGLVLTLVDDFYSSIPTELTTAKAVLPPDSPEKAAFTRNRGIRFEPSARRGFTVILVPGDAAVKPDAPQHVTDLAPYTAGGNAPSVRIAALARELRQRAGNSDREYLRLLLEHFSVGYRYSLETARQRKNADPIEDFVFEGKQGFCLYFAGAFVLLAREGGLPARLAEGFRVTLDERGQGTISGSNAHAWPEVWIDGEWRMFEPTPPYASDDPFSYIRENDEAARRQLEALFGKEGGAEKKRFDVREIPVVALRLFAAVALAAAAGVVALRFAKRKKNKLRRKAARMVRYWRKRGVSGPEYLGWKEWARQADALARERNGKIKTAAADIAAAMMETTFGGE